TPGSAGCWSWLRVARQAPTRWRAPPGSTLAIWPPPWCAWSWPGTCARIPPDATNGRRWRSRGRPVAATSLSRVSEQKRVPVAMTIATSDSGGGAGIQADLKAFARCGVHGTSAIVALTAQNTHEVVSVQTLPREFILDQVRAVSADLGVDAVKIGM